jgi:hypothetical protein
VDTVKVSATPAEIERVEAEVRERSLKRALSRQERGLPLTQGLITLIVRDEARRVCARFVASKPN